MIHTSTDTDEAGLVGLWSMGFGVVWSFDRYMSSIVVEIFVRGTVTADSKCYSMDIR